MSEIENEQAEQPVEAVDAEPTADERVETEIRLAEAEGLQHRAMHMDSGAVDEENRRAMIAVSSEEPVQRSFGMEVLEHSPEAIDMAFLASGRAPLLMDHNPERQIGVIESVSLDDDRRLRAQVRFSRNALGDEAFTDVLDGIRANISVGYSIEKLEKSGADTYIAKRWTPMEASLVSIPADKSAGVGRSQSVTADEVRAETTPEKPVIKITDTGGNTMSEEIDVAAVEAQARKAAQKDASAIVELGARHNRSDLASESIRDGLTIDQFRGKLLEEIGSEKALVNQDIGLTQKERQRFSLIRAIAAMANPSDRRAQEAAAFEFECSAAAAKQYGREARGVMLPNEVMTGWKRDLNTSDDSAVIDTDFRAGDFIDVLRNTSSVMMAGARQLTGLQGDIAIPKQLTASTAAWLAAEGNDVANSEPTFGQVTMTQRDLGVYTQVTRRMMQSAAMDIEAVVRDDLARSIALGLDAAALSGSGASGQPTGIKNTAGINSVDFGTAPVLVPSYAQVVEMETAVGTDNALVGNLAYILNASMAGALKTTEKASGTAMFVWEPGNTLNGYQAIVSNQAAAGDLYFGDFDSLLLGFWGGLDILVDQYSNSLSGTVRIRAIQTMDVAVRHAVSFCLGNDGGS